MFHGFSQEDSFAWLPVFLFLLYIYILCHNLCLVNLCGSSDAYNSMIWRLQIQLHRCLWWHFQYKFSLMFPPALWASCTPSTLSHRMHYSNGYILIVFCSERVQVLPLIFSLFEITHYISYVSFHKLICFVVSKLGPIKYRAKDFSTVLALRRVELWSNESEPLSILFLFFFAPLFFMNFIPHHYREIFKVTVQSVKKYVYTFYFLIFPHFGLIIIVGC